MKSSNRLRASLLLLPLLLVVSGCAKQAVTRPAFPSAIDLAVKAKPVPPVEIVSDARADALYNSKLEAWGESGWAQVARLCNWAKTLGATVDCEAQ